MFARHVRPLRVFYTALPCALALLPASLSRVDDVAHAVNHSKPSITQCQWIGLRENLNRKP